MCLNPTQLQAKKGGGKTFMKFIKFAALAAFAAASLGLSACASKSEPMTPAPTTVYTK